MDYQHGFKKGRSCETQLLITIEDIAKQLDEVWDPYLANRYDHPRLLQSFWHGPAPTSAS